MSQRSIYEAFPSIEKDWEGFGGKQARHFAQMSEWYYSRLSGLGGPVCELGCGYGRLLLPLARNGVEVHGTDAIAARIEAARETFAGEQLSNAYFHHCTMPQMPAGLRFRAVLLAANAIGYLLTCQEKQTLFNNIAASLDNDGLLLMDFAMGSCILHALRFWPGLRGEIFARSGKSLHSSLHWSGQRNAIAERFVLRNEARGSELFCDYFRFESVSTTIAQLKQAGFEVVEAAGSFDGSAHRFWSRRLALVARRGRRNYRYTHVGI